MARRSAGAGELRLASQVHVHFGRSRRPEFAGISGSFDATESSARVVFATRKGELYLPRVFPQPRMPLDFLNGLVEWERQGEGAFSLRLASIALQRAVEQPCARHLTPGTGPGTIISAQLNRADATHLALPAARQPDGRRGRARLAHAQRARRPLGRRARAHPRRPARFPFVDPASGEFSVAARIERGVLHYAEAWPRIENIRGELLFERSRMHIAGRSASVLGAPSPYRGRHPAAEGPEPAPRGERRGAAPPPSSCASSRQAPCAAWRAASPAR